MSKYLMLAAVLLSSLAACAEKRPVDEETERPHLLIFTKTAEFRHDNIEKGVEALTNLCIENNLKSDHSEDASLFSDENLEKYDAVIFFSTTGDILNDIQKRAFQKFIQSGKGFVGIHAASDTEYNWPWYGKMVGAYFASHPAVQDADIHVIEKEHPSTKHLPDVWTRKDEWYDFKDYNEQVTLLMTLDEGSYEGGKMGDFHPVSWYHEYDGGKAWYTALGHTKESFDEPLFLQHILGGIHSVLD